ncbi:MAG TPA: long-chain fatty acid--CoA ligase [Mycobacteriales bacterium]
MSASSWVSGWARIKPAAPAVVFEDRVVIWQDLDRRATEVARAFVGAGVRPGDRVACLMHNRVEFIEVFVGALRAGAVFVPLNALATAPELAALVADCSATAVVTDASFACVVAGMAGQGTVTTFVSVDGPLNGDHFMLEELIDAAPSDVVFPSRTGADTMCIYYTSGTTGQPKGAVVSHDNVRYATLNWLVDLGFWQNDRFLLNLPLCFTGAMAIVAPALHGGITIELERAFDAGRTLELIERDRITFMVAVPTMAMALMRHPDFGTRDLSSLRMILCGAAPVPMMIFEAFTERGIPFISSFGMTEVAGGFAMITPVGEARERLGTAGRPCLYTEARLVFPDGTDTPDGEVGELLLRGPLVFQGYWDNPAETAATIVDGWLYTGDLARREPSGYYWIVDRKKDSIISGGLNVYPAEIENAVIRHPAVRECAVFGVPDEKWGELVTAVVVVAPGAELTREELQEHCRSLVATYRIPRRIEFRDALPRTTSGKVLRRTLRAELIGEPAPSATSAR